ncbi:MAG: hypothetical protein K2I93_03985 [Oscillospiraceae bacterium]|nr:hypothetical protein [Oscillospiraceae bacterium]
MSDKETPLVIHAEANGETVAVSITGNGDGTDLLNTYASITEAVMKCLEEGKGEELTEQQVFEMITYCIGRALFERKREKEAE